MEINWNYKNNSQVFRTVEKGGVPFLSFRALEDTGIVTNGFSTRFGGVSQGMTASMNLSYSRDEDPAHVRENFTRMSKALGVERDRMVLSWQTHTVNVRRVTGEDGGKGIIKERDYRDVDGLITNEPGVTLVTIYADCVPLYLVDPVGRAIGLSHSGWRGTVKRMGQATICAMGREFGTKPGDLVACIGPSICRDCYEVGEEVAEAFRNAFDRPYWQELLQENGTPGKYRLDLWKANEIIFREAGVPAQQIHTTNICTMCNSDTLFSHRRAGEKRGNLGAFLCLNQPEVP